MARCDGYLVACTKGFTLHIRPAVLQSLLPKSFVGESLSQQSWHWVSASFCHLSWSSSLQWSGLKDRNTCVLLPTNTFVFVELLNPLSSSKLVIKGYATCLHSKPLVADLVEETILTHRHNKQLSLSVLTSLYILLTQPLLLLWWWKVPQWFPGLSFLACHSGQKVTWSSWEKDHQLFSFTPSSKEAWFNTL